MKQILITIDTEMDADIHWRKKSPITFISILEGIPKYYRPIWDKYNIYPIYFVSPEVLEDDDCCEVLKGEIDKGAIIGAHLHPEYIDPDKTEIDLIEAERFPCFGYAYEIEKLKLKNLKELIESKLSVTPIWYRAARFGADEDSIKILSELGFRYDSSFTPGIDWRAKKGPDHSKIQLTPYIIEPYGIKEYPITICGKRFGVIGKLMPDNWLFYKWLRPTHMTYFEEKCLIKELKRKGIDQLVMMFHSMEIMVNKTPYVRNKWMQCYYLWRMEKTIKYALKKGYISYRMEEG